MSFGLLADRSLGCFETSGHYSEYLTALMELARSTERSRLKRSTGSLGLKELTDSLAALERSTVSLVLERPTDSLGLERSTDLCEPSYHMMSRICYLMTEHFLLQLRIF